MSFRVNPGVSRVAWWGARGRPLGSSGIHWLFDEIAQAALLTWKVRVVAGGSTIAS